MITVSFLSAASKPLSDYLQEEHASIIRKYVQNKFDKNLPGLSSYRHRGLHDPSVLFELESGLFAQEYIGANILGFNVGFYFRDGHNIILDGKHRVQLVDTEFDVVTDKFLIESKWSYDMQSYDHEGLLEQLVKEMAIASWLGAVDEEVFSGDLKIQYFLSKKGKPLFALQGKSTGGKRVVLECSWVTGTTERVCVKQFINAVMAIAHKIPITGLTQ